MNRGRISFYEFDKIYKGLNFDRKRVVEIVEIK